MCEHVSIFLSSLVIGAAADVAMHRGGLDWLSTRRGLIETGFEDGADGGIAERIDRQCPIARRFQTLGAVPARER